MGTGAPVRARMPAWSWTSWWLAAYVAASVLGRAVVVQPENVGLVWPAAGVALVWLIGSDRRQLPLDVVLMSVATASVLAATEGGVRLSVLSLSVVVQTLLVVWVLRRLVPGIWGTGGRQPFTRLGQFGRILGAVAGAALVAGALRWAVGSLLFTAENLETFAGRVGRQASAMATIGVFGLLLCGYVAQQRDRGLPVLVRPSRRDLAHLLGIEALSALIFVAFWLDPDIPTTYVLSLTVVWAALRFGPVVTALHCLLAGAVTVVMTIEGFGPIATVVAPQTRAVLAQIFVVVLMVTGLTIALIRRQIAETIGRLERSEASLASRADELDLRAQELDLVLAHLDDGVAIIEESGRVVHANTAMRTGLGTRPLDHSDRVRTEAASQLYLSDGQPLSRERHPFARALAGEVVTAEEYHHTAADGRALVVEVSAFPVPTMSGADRRVMIVVRDVTSASTHRESLVSFAGTVAHDLNNPLSVIDGWAEALEEDLRSTDRLESVAVMPMVEHIRTSVDQARAFIQDLLAHSVARDQALECEQVPLRNLVKHIAGTRDRPRQGAEIIAGELPDVWADRVLLRQVLDNLIGNALKYVAPGVVPRVRVEAEPAADGWVRVFVRDNGIGVPFLQRERIFESFHRATEGYQGTGLGLAICQRIIRRHGGDIRVTANPDGVGSSFEFTLPTSSAALQRVDAE